MKMVELVGLRKLKDCEFVMNLIVEEKEEKEKKSMSLGKMSTGIFPHVSGREEG